jgi:hypothetical protein
MAVLAQGSPNWRSLGDGIEYATIQIAQKPTVGDGKLHAVRVDPERVELRAVLASELRVPNRTAGAWADDLGLTVAINAGMFETDYSSNVGHLRNGEHFNNRRWNRKYQSVLALNPVGSGPKAAFVDLDDAGGRDQVAGYRTVIQNLRLMKGRRQNVWKPSARKWSEAAVASDEKGRILFLFCRTPFTMHELNERLRALPLGIVRAMHVEGGPEASLSIRAEGLSLDLAGSFETGFNEKDDNPSQWPITNVIGVVRKK